MKRAEIHLIVITGPSGAGKTLALHSLEDAGFYGVSNLPPTLLPAFRRSCQRAGRASAAAVVDIRCGVEFRELPRVIAAERKAGVRAELLFLDAASDMLVQRFKTTRRPHPLLPDFVDNAAGPTILDAICREKELLATAREHADRILDTTEMTPLRLRDTLHRAYAGDVRPDLVVTVTSFGFKHGLPIDADLVFDVRFLANPHYVAELSRLGGLDERVAAYVHADPLTSEFERRMDDVVTFTLPHYIREGKAYLTIAIGCTGGRHRSVVVATDLAERLRGAGYRVAVRHRDLDREPDIDATGDGFE